MLKQDLIIGIVSVSAIVYVILFDSSPGGIFPGQGAGPLTGAPSSQAQSVRTTEPALLTPGRDAEPGESPGRVTPAPSRLLVIGSEGTITPQARAKLIEEVRRWIGTPVPGDFDRLKESFEAMSQVADSVALFRVPLDEQLSRAFQEKMAELKRYYLLQRTTILLAEVANNYLVPGSTEYEKINLELARLRELERDVEWVEQRYEFVYPKDRKEYLKQLIEVLAGMKKG